MVGTGESYCQFDILQVNYSDSEEHWTSSHKDLGLNHAWRHIVHYNSQEYLLSISIYCHIPPGTWCGHSLLVSDRSMGEL